jgi:hypothetical protein
MNICPVCNGFSDIQSDCSKCGQPLHDEGRVMDFYDDYSAYMPIDMMKMEDGFPSDFKNKECPHLLKCSICGQDEIIFIKE